MSTTETPTPWQGRDDQDDPLRTQRWYQHVVSPHVDASQNPSQNYGLIGFCCDTGVKRNGGRIGAAEGPMVLRQQLGNLAWHGGDMQLVDFGDITARNDALEDGQEQLANQVAIALPKVSRLLVVGGGHETAFGSFSGLYNTLGADAKIGIINLDAHFDLRCPGAAGPSSGTPFFQIQALIGAANFNYCCLGVAKEANTDALFRRADEWGVRYRTDMQMTLAQQAQIRAELNAFAKPMDALYLSIDLDVLPHYQAPGVSAPAVRGVGLEVIEAVIDQVLDCAKHCRLGLPLVELTELNPRYDPQGVTARTAAVLASRMLKKI
jgi:formiminoglutamase